MFRELHAAKRRIATEVDKSSNSHLEPRDRIELNPPDSGLPDISNNAGSVNLFLSALLRSLVRVVLLVLFLPLCINDHGSFVICRANSARPKHLFDQNFDHDYYFKLPFQGAGCPIKWTTL